MIKQATQRNTKFTRGETISYRQFFDSVADSIPFTQCLGLTTLPRGTLQIAQPQRVPEALRKGYAKVFHSEDRASWKAILGQRPVRGADCWRGQFADSRYLQEFLAPLGLFHIAAAPLRAPVLEGYPGAIHLYRTADERDFTAAELQKLGDLASQLDAAIDKVRQARLGRPVHQKPIWAHRAPVRHMILDHKMRPQLPRNDLAVPDEHLQHEIIRHARQGLHNLNGEQMISRRQQLPDSRGDLWTFRVVTHREYPALGEGPFIFFCLHPECCDWRAVRSSDFQADEELARMVPAMKFMAQEFARGPTLFETAAQVHLSPFHFHRRFQELLGLTPKQFMMEFQIYEAKRQLLAREKDLAQIAADCGFAHQSHFTSRFKQVTGLTPTRWRRMMLEVQRASRN